MPVSAPPQATLYCVRGALFTQLMQFSSVPADGTGWTATMVIRRRQSDDSPLILTGTGAWLTPVDAAQGGLAEFTFTAAQTATLPARGAVYYVDLISGGAPRRAIMGDLQMKD
jgi:hypothetical protein